MTKLKIGIVSLGCDKNRVDSEIMLGKLADDCEITAEPENADVIIVNTCAFLEASRKEAIDTIFEMAEYKRTGCCKKLIVTGCLGQLCGKEVFEQMPEVDCVVGTNNYDEIANVLREVVDGKRICNICNTDKLVTGKRVLTTPKHYAYLKIADGCNNFCTYCLIPYIRGRYRSIPMEEVVQEANLLAQSGVKELILVAQDTTRYGKDIYGEPRIVELLQRLSNINGIEWIRLLYCYPELMTDELIHEIATNGKVVKYIDIPLQHIDDGILKRMNRRSNNSSICQLFDKLSVNNIAVRSTFICGFPGENTETEKELSSFLLSRKLRNVGFFAFSPEEGTPAFSFEPTLTPKQKEKMVERMYKAQHKVIDELNNNNIGKVYSCIVDDIIVDDIIEENCDGYVYIGRTEFMSPEIDGNVYIHSKNELTNGDIVKVQITSALEYDLVGDVL